MDIAELANLVLDWAKVDEVVAEKGWDGGALDAKWDDAKRAMVDAASAIVGRRAEGDAT